jgi:hypothetical protein
MLPLDLDLDAGVDHSGRAFDGIDIIRHLYCRFFADSVPYHQEQPPIPAAQPRDQPSGIGGGSARSRQVTSSSAIFSVSAAMFRAFASSKRLFLDGG